MFKRVARDNSYKGRPLVEEFKREMDERIRKRLVEAEFPPKSINQWYERAVKLDRNYRKSRREKKEKRRGELKRNGVRLRK